MSRHSEIDVTGDLDFFQMLRLRWTKTVYKLQRLIIRLRRNDPSGPELIDSAHQRLAVQGGLAAKPAYVYPSERAPLLASIVIPCYNYGIFLPEAVASALCQTLAGAEIIIVDDASDDPHTLAVLASYANQPRIRIIRHETNQGLPAARNSGIGHARGEFICCLDADDALDPTYLKKCIALLMSDCSLGFAYSWVRLFGDTEGVWKTRNFDIEESLLNNHTSVSAVYRRDDWEACGGFDPSMHGGYDDWEFWLRLAQLGRRGRVITEPLLNHRKHGKNMTNEADAGRGHWLREIRRKNPSVFDDAAWRGRIRAVAPAFIAQNPFSRLVERQNRPTGDARPHLLVVVPWLPMGGAEVLLADILTHVAAGWRLTIVTTMPSDHSMEGFFKAIAPEIYHLTNVFDPRFWLEFIVALMESLGTDAILSSGSQFFYDSLESIKSRFPAIRTFDILHNDIDHLASALKSTRYIDCHIAVSERIGQSLNRGGVALKSITVIPNGVDSEHLFKPGRVAVAAARTGFGIEADAFVIGFVGRMSKEKRPLAFLNVVAPILAAHSAAQLLVVGDGPLTKSFTAAAHAASITSRLRHVRNLEHGSMPNFYAACDIIVLTSEIEGMPLAVLEALAMGCPVAVTDAGDLQSVVTHGVNGFIAASGSPADLTSGIAALALDRERLANMRVAARQSILETRFSADRMLNDYEDLLGLAASASNGGERLPLSFRGRYDC